MVNLQRVLVTEQVNAYTVEAPVFMEVHVVQYTNVYMIVIFSFIGESRMPNHNNIIMVLL
jgi:hypothetical protein